MIELRGEVDAYDGWLPWDVSIGGVRLIEALRREGLEGQEVVVAIETRPTVTEASGTLRAFEGFGGTDVTPAEAPEIAVGDADLFRRLADMDGEHVVVCVDRRVT